MIEELIKTDFETFKSNVGDIPVLYHCTTLDAIKGISKHGASREYTGKNSNYYGQGFYTTFELGSSVDNQNSIYGRYIIKFGLANGFKDFLFFDEEMNKKYNGDEPIKDQIERLCPPDIVKKLEDGGFYIDSGVYWGGTTHHLTGKNLTAALAKRFFEILKGEKLTNSLSNGIFLYDELDISKTKVRGYIFVGSNDGEVCVVRDFNSLIPLAYFDPTKGNNPMDENDSGWIDIFNKETYDTIAGSVDIGTEIRGEYPETPFNTKTICGYVLVKKDGKYNYVNINTMEELLPVFADKAIDFDPDTKMAKFVIGGDEYEYSAKNKVFIEDGVFIYDKDEFVEELKDKGVLNESVKYAISLINRINNL